MKILAYRKEEDQFWIACSKDEAERWFIPRLSDENLNNFKNLKEGRGHWNEENMSICMDMMKLLGVEELDYAYFNVSRDLSVCYSSDPYYPVSPWWNGLSPFVVVDLAVIQSPDELAGFVPTSGGKAVSRH